MSKVAYRDRITISEKILRTLNGSSKKKSRIMHEAFLTTRELKEYIWFMIENHLVEYNPKDNTYSATRKGISLLILIKSVKDYLNQQDSNRESI
jgi:predicted transcriptional regulator